MKTKSIKLLVVLLAVSVLSMCAAASDNVSFRRQQIEENYSAGMSQLYAKAEREARKLHVTDRLLWLEFITGDETPYSDSFSLYTIGGGSGSLSYSRFYELDEELVSGSVLIASASESHAHKLSTLTGPQRHLQAHLADSYSLGQFAMFLLSEESGMVFSNIADSRFQNRRLRNQARRLLRIADRFRIEAREIEAERYAALAAMQRAEEYTYEQASAPIEQVQVQPQTIEPGVVSAISYSAKGSICMVEGVDEVLRSGDVINTENIKGVKVVSISRNSVGFSKKGKAWTQVLGEEANSRMID